MAFIACAEEAAVPIKSYSPDIVVVPLLPLRRLLPNDADEQRLKGLLSRTSAICVGSGLGRDPDLTDQLFLIFEHTKGSFVLLDGDFFWHFNHAKQTLLAILKHAGHVVFTPNRREFELLWRTFSDGQPFDWRPLQAALDAVPIGEQAMTFDSTSEAASAYSPIYALLNKMQLPNAHILLKGRCDVIIGPEQTVVCPFEGSAKRCGGQGDILAGIAAVFGSWAAKRGRPLPAALCAAARLTRRAAHLAWQEKGMSLVASDILAVLPAALKQLL